MAGDRWASSGLNQLLFYASMMANRQQMDRLALQYPEEFGGADGLSLGLFYEQRQDTRFPADVDRTLEFLADGSTRQYLGRYFDGILVLELAQDGSSPVHWRVASDWWISWA